MSNQKARCQTSRQSAGQAKRAPDQQGRMSADRPFPGPAFSSILPRQKVAGVPQRRGRTRRPKGAGRVPSQSWQATASGACHGRSQFEAGVAVLPGACIFVTSICFNLVSDGLRQAMDVKG